VPIVLIGGTRGTGLLIAHRLVAKGEAVTVLARDVPAAQLRLARSVQVIYGDLTRPETLPLILAGASHIIVTAGCRSGRPVDEGTVRAVEYDGVGHALAAARQTGFTGRFLYMNPSGVNSRSFWTRALNLYKGNTLIWRARAEAAIRESGIDYTIIRVGFLLNSRGGRHALRITTESLPLSPRLRIARADVAEVFVAALDHPRTTRATFDVVWGSGGRRESCSELLDRLLL
jgi:uncharacterized protein YbjT (DUF2867 family)